MRGVRLFLVNERWRISQNFVPHTLVQGKCFSNLILPQGDVQMCATALIVLGDKIKSQVDEVAQEQWFMSYIGTDLLVYCQALN